MHLPDVPVVAVDTETSGLHADDGARVAVVSIAWEGGVDAWPFDQGPRDKPDAPTADLLSMLTDDPNLGQQQWLDLLDWLATRKVLIMHNAKFDLAMLRTGTRHWAGVDLAGSGPEIWDTMIVQSVLEPQHPLGLKAVAARLWGEDEAAEKQQLDKLLKAAKGKKNRYDLLAWDDISAYARKDAELTYRLYQHQQATLATGELEYPQQRTQIQTEHALMVSLYNMERRGMHFDVDGSREQIRILEERRAGLVSTLPYRPTINAVKEWYFGGTEQRYLAYAGRTPKGGVSLDEQTLRKMVTDGLPHAATWDAVTRIDKAISMWYRGYADMTGEDGRLRTEFKQTKVVSGRMSVGRVQLQAIPKADKALDGVIMPRELFATRPGYSLWNLDLSQAELRVAAKYAGCKTMLDALLEGADFHGITCEAVLGTKKGHPDFDRDRDIAKRLTFGSIFLIGGRKFQATLARLANIHLPLEQCETIVARWRKTYPEFGVIYRQLDRIVEKRRWVWVLPDPEAGVHVPGRYSDRSRFGRDDWPHTAWNRVVQGSLAQFNKLWLPATERWLVEAGQPEALVLNVHDSVVLELPISEGQEVAQEVARRTGALATERFGVEMKADIKFFNSRVQNEYNDFVGSL